MDAKYEIAAEPERDLVRMTMSGFFSLGDVARLDRERLGAYSRLTCRPNDHLTICDVSGMKIQSQDVVAAFTRMASDPRYASRKLAFVTGSSLARMQTRRVTDREDVAYFTDMREAESWLFS